MAGETPCPRQHPQVNTASSNAHEREEKSGRLTETFASGWAHAARTLELMELMELMEGECRGGEHLSIAARLVQPQ